MSTTAEYENRGRDDMPEATGATPEAQQYNLGQEIKAITAAVLADPPARLTLPEIIYAAEGERHARLSQYAAESKGRLIPDPELHRLIDNILTEMGL